jgi:hypothetical protein
MVSQDSILADVFNEVYTVLNANAYSVTLDSGTATLRTWGTNKYWTGAYPEIEVDSKSEYPIGIIHTATLTEYETGLRIVDHAVRIEIEILTTSGEQASRFADKVKDAMEDAIDTFEDAGLHRKSIGTMRSDVIFRSGSKLKIHSVTIPYEFEYSLVRS